MRQELIVAEKEFRDHLTSKVFLMVFVILMLVTIVMMAQGMADYNYMIDQYKKNGADVSMMPSALTVYGTLNKGFGYGIGVLTSILLFLSIVMGFDLITREREEGTLKSLLSHPVYRDAVINGKFLGGMAVLAVAVGSVFLVSLAIMLFYGMVPSGDDLLRLVLYFSGALLYCAVFFAIATLFSAAMSSSAMSILGALGLAFCLIFVPVFAPNIASLTMGPAPEYGFGHMPGDDIQQYYTQKQMITDAISTVSPAYSFGEKIGPAIISNQDARPRPPLFGSLYQSATEPDIYTSPSVWDSLATCWMDILALLIEMVVPLAASYILFMRSDVR